MNGASLATSASSSNSGETLSEERLFDLLGNERRRSCLQCLIGLEGAIPVQDLANQVATSVSGEDRSASDIRDSVYISLCQNHLPKLDDAGVVEYDSGEKTVSPGPAFPAVERHLQVDSAEATDGDAAQWYVLASVVTVLVLAPATYAVPTALPVAVPMVLTLHGVVALAIGRRLL